MEATLAKLCLVWSRPVQLLTVLDEKRICARHDGERLKLTTLGQPR